MVALLDLSPTPVVMVSVVTYLSNDGIFNKNQMLPHAKQPPSSY